MPKLLIWAPATRVRCDSQPSAGRRIFPLAGTDLARSTRCPAEPPWWRETLADMALSSTTPQAKLFAQGAMTIHLGEIGGAVGADDSEYSDQEA
jgi:hypothetical protein